MFMLVVFTLTKTIIICLILFESCQYSKSYVLFAFRFLDMVFNTIKEFNLKYY